MDRNPEFPEFKPVELEDGDRLQEIIWGYQPQTSEWTFTNLLIWNHRYGFQWSLYRDWLLVICSPGQGEPHALQPLGPAPRKDSTRVLLEWLREQRGVAHPQIERGDERLVAEINGDKRFNIEPTREHFDYLYDSSDLIRLAGRKYHSKKNHLNAFRSTHRFDYVPIDENLVQNCLRLAEQWCQWRRCREDMNLMDEWGAARQALEHFSALRIMGGAILIEGQVQAFALGEPLNERTTVVHIEKADSRIRELYAVINQQFCEHACADRTYVNREQDLGEPGLRQAKLSYHPCQLVKKYRIQFTRP